MRQLKITNNITNRDSQSLEKYLQDIAKVPMINAEEEVELAIKIKNGDRRALDKLVRANLRFVVSVAKQYQHQGLPLSDLINEGNLGLIRAAEKFDETRGFKFISYAVWWIRQSILQGLVEQSRIVRMPLNKVGTFGKINRAMQAFEQQYQREPSAEELSKLVDMRVKDIKDFLNDTRHHVSTDTKLGDGDSDTFGDLMSNEEDEIGIPDSVLMKQSMKQDVEAALSSLTQREAEILACYYGLGGETPMTLEEIGERFDLTRERVRQIKEKCLRRLRKSSRGTLASYVS